MIEITIHGRGGQGGVTLAKLVATAYFLRGEYAQAFGVYAAERSGAPLQAYIRIDREPIVNHNQVRQPDHVVVLDRTLISPKVSVGLKPEGWLILNSPAPPESFAEMFPGRRVATLDATAIAVRHGLGTRAVPIVNTTMLGAVLRVMGLEWSDVEKSLGHVKFGGPNVAAAQAAFEGALTARVAGTIQPPTPATVNGHVAGLFDQEVGERPKIRTGSWATSIPERRTLTPPCNDGCPAGNDVRGFVQAVAQQDYTAALETILRTSPLPGVCGRVCPAPCMQACNRNTHDEPVNVRELERYVAEHGVWPHATQPTRPERVAVVGSGPAGLSATYHLARLGYPVTLFERDHELGGLLRSGIPRYRLPRETLDHEISFILQHGVKALTDHAVGRGDWLKLTHEYAALFIATGLQHYQSLDLGPESRGLVEEGIEFLARIARAHESLRGKHVLVIGGGNTAIDAARTARRLGAEHVQIIYRRTRAEMPAIAEEIDEALEEGIELHELVAPLRIHRDDVGPLLTCGRMTLGEPDASGRRRPIPLTSEDAQVDFRAEKIILALGQSQDLTILPEGASIRDGDSLLGMTGAPVFFGGDLSTNEGTVAAAIGSGRRAAWHIHRTLTGEDLFPPAPAPVAGVQEIHLHAFAHRPAEHGEQLDPVARRFSFAEVREGLLDEPGMERALSEAQRCFSCGVCNHCDTCVNYCPEAALRREGDVLHFDYDYCKGCGVCASQCPRGVIYMTEL